MVKKRPQKTLADYLVIAITPALIMLMVGSLSLFLLEVRYSGQFQARARWIMFWFVFASVLVSRISIEQGADYAAMFGLALAAATALVIFRFVDAPGVAIVLLLVVWWCVKKLTWDCTLIDEKQDASGEGLLQRAGLNRDDEIKDQATDAPQNADKAQSEQRETNSPEPSEPRTNWWSRLWDDRRKKTDQAHAPGVWVVYLSLAALPLFGIGELMLDTDDESARRYGFLLLWIYVASGLGLLLTTSFLGLRRYLRQRRLKMPATMAGMWIGLGTALIAVILLLCILLPRPQAHYSLAGLIDRVSREAQQASRVAFLRDESGEGEGRRIGKGDDDPDEADKPSDEAKDDASGSSDETGNGAAKDDDADQEKSSKPSDSFDDSEGEKQQQSGEQQDANSDTAEKGGAQGQGESKGGQQSDKKGDSSKSKSGEQAKSGQNDDSQSDREEKGSGDKDADDAQQPEPDQQAAKARKSSPSVSRDASQWVANIVKAAIYGLLAIIVAIALYRNWPRIAAALRIWWQQQLQFFRTLFGGRRRSRRETGEPEDDNVLVPRRPFASFVNPFSTGAANTIPPEELVVYTFEAIEAWAFERDAQRLPEQTPLEFTRRLTQQHAHLQPHVRQIAEIYARIAYANQRPGSECLAPLEQLWRKMTRPTDDVALQSSNAEQSFTAF